jgi:hypothetical protein
MLLVILLLHLPRFFPEGRTFLLHVHLEDRIVLALVAPIHLEAPIIFSLLVFRFLLEVNLKLGENIKFGGNLKLGDNLNLGGNLKLEDIAQFIGKLYLC